MVAYSPRPELARQVLRDPVHWLPFGLGPRKCPGAAFALQEALLVLAELVRRHRLVKHKASCLRYLASGL